MNKQQQQNAMLKLATVRLAINHVLRSRAMQKQAIYEEQQAPDPLPLSEISPEYSYLLRLADTFENSPNNFDNYSGNHDTHSSAFKMPYQGDNNVEARSLAERATRDPKYALSEEFNKRRAALYGAYNGANIGTKRIETAPQNNLPFHIYEQSVPAWGIDSVMNKETPLGKDWALDLWMRQQKAPKLESPMPKKKSFFGF